MAYIEDGVLYAGKYRKGQSGRKRLGVATEADYANPNIEKIGPGAVETAKKAAGAAVDAITGFFGGGDKKEKKKKDSLASKIGFNKGGYIGKPRKGHTDYRFNKGGMVMSSTNNMKKK